MVVVIVVVLCFAANVVFRFVFVVCRLSCNFHLFDCTHFVVAREWPVFSLLWTVTRAVCTSSVVERCRRFVVLSFFPFVFRLLFLPSRPGATDVFPSQREAKKNQQKAIKI